MNWVAGRAHYRHRGLGAASDLHRGLGLRMPPLRSVGWCERRKEGPDEPGYWHHHALSGQLLRRYSSGLGSRLGAGRVTSTELHLHGLPPGEMPPCPADEKASLNGDSRRAALLVR